MVNQYQVFGVVGTGDLLCRYIDQRNQAIELGVYKDFEDCVKACKRHHESGWVAICEEQPPACVEFQGILVPWPASND
jgi:hypothetical protein